MKVKTPKNFNVNYKIAITCIKLHWQLQCSCESYKWTFISERVFKVSTTSTNTRSQMVKPLVNHSANDVLTKVKPSLHQVSSQVVDVMNLIFLSYMHCSITLQISKFKAHDDRGPLRWSMIHLMQFLFGNIPVIKYIFGVLTFKGSVTTLSRWSGWS